MQSTQAIATHLGVTYNAARIYLECEFSCDKDVKDFHAGRNIHTGRRIKNAAQQKDYSAYDVYTRRGFVEIDKTEFDRLVKVVKGINDASE